jgi:predicted dienelactone hydrolase
MALVLRFGGHSVIGTSQARKNAARAIQTCISPA